MPLLLEQNLLLGVKPSPPPPPPPPPGFPEGGLGIANKLPRWSATEGPPAYVIIRDPGPLALRAQVRVRAWSSLSGTLTVTFDTDTDDEELMLVGVL